MREMRVRTNGHRPRTVVPTRDARAIPVSEPPTTVSTDVPPHSADERPQQEQTARVSAPLEQTTEALAAETRVTGTHGDHGGSHHGGKPSYGAVFRNRAFMSLWIAQIVSQLAQNLTWISLGAYVASVNQQGKNTLVSVIIVSALLAQFLLSPFAGVLVDRVSKRAVLLGSNVIRVVLTLSFILFAGTLPLPLGTRTTAIIVLIFVANSVAQFFAPAEAVTIPLVVERRNLVVASSLFNITFNVCQALPVIVGLLVLQLIGIVPVLLVVAALYVCAALLVATLPAKTMVARPGPVAGSLGAVGRHMLTDMREALRFLARDPGLRLTIFQINVAPTFLFVFGSLGLIFVHDTFNLREDQAWILLLPAGAGLVFGALAMSRLAARRRKEDLINLGLLTMGISVTVLGAVAVVVKFLSGTANRIGGFINQHIHSVHTAPALPAVVTGPRHEELIVPAMVIAVVIGLGMALSTIPAQTLVFERTDEEVRGRIWSIQQLIGGAIPIIPLLTVAWLADTYGTSTVMTGLGVVIALVGVFGMRVDHKLYKRQTRRARLR